jgi:hypothetical protein
MLLCVLIALLMLSLPGCSNGGGATYPATISVPADPTYDSKDEDWVRTICRRAINVQMVAQGNGVSSYEAEATPIRTQDGMFIHSGTVIAYSGLKPSDTARHAFQCTTRNDDNANRPNGSWTIWRLSLDDVV